MREELKGFRVVKDRDDVKVIVLQVREMLFSAGGDLSALKEVDAVSGRKRLQSGHELLKSLSLILRSLSLQRLTVLACWSGCQSRISM